MQQIQGKRVYVVTTKVEEKDFMFGIFTNRKIMFEQMTKIGLQSCYIKGARKNKQVTPQSIATGFIGRGLTIYKNIQGEEQQVVKILQIRLNEINPFFRRRFVDGK